MCADIEFYCLYDALKAHAGFLALHDFFHDQGLSYRCASGIEYVNLQILVLLLRQVCTEHCAVIGTAELCGKCDRVAPFCSVQKRFPEIIRRRAGGFRALRAFRYSL